MTTTTVDEWADWLRNVSDASTMRARLHEVRGLDDRARLAVRDALLRPIDPTGQLRAFFDETNEYTPKSVKRALAASRRATNQYMAHCNKGAHNVVAFDYLTREAEQAGAFGHFFVRGLPDYPGAFVALAQQPNWSVPWVHAAVRRLLRLEARFFEHDPELHAFRVLVRERLERGAIDRNGPLYEPCFRIYAKLKSDSLRLQREG